MKFIFSGLDLPATGAWCRIAQINKRTDLQIKLAAMACDVSSGVFESDFAVNDDYVGDAPISITVPTDRAKFTKVTIIRATPTLQGEYVQSKHFDATEEVPSRILFSMGSGHAL